MANSDSAQSARSATPVALSWKWVAIVSVTILASLLGGWGAEMMGRQTRLMLRLDGHEQRIDALEKAASIVARDSSFSLAKLGQLEARQIEVLTRITSVEEQLKMLVRQHGSRQ